VATLLLPEELCMLEIFLLYHLCKNIGKRMRAKGYKPVWLQILMVLMWFGGEVFGAMVAAIVAMIAASPANLETFEPPMLPVYLGALIGAACGAGIVFTIVALLPDKLREAKDGAAGDARCPGCGEPVSATAGRCPLCGQLLERDLATPERGT
jgi:hypothetical protein